MRVLVACEESQALTIELRKLGHEAYSCDIESCSGGHPEWHIQQDVLPLLNGKCKFKTVDGAIHKINGKWDMIIAFPPCTYLTGAGAANIPKQPERIQKGYEAAKFFKLFLSADCERIAVENPPPMKRFCLPPYSQIIQPYDFGHPANKKTAIWIKGLPPLMATDIVSFKPDLYYWTYKGKQKSGSKWYNSNSKNHSLHRSKTFPGIAKAMAEQWAGQTK